MIIIVYLLTDKWLLYKLSDTFDSIARDRQFEMNWICPSEEALFLRIYPHLFEFLFTIESVKEYTIDKFDAIPFFLSSQ